MADEVKVTEPKKTAKKEPTTVQAVMANLGASSGVREVVGVIEEVNGCTRTTLWAKGKEKKLSGE